MIPKRIVTLCLAFLLCSFLYSQTEGTLQDVENKLLQAKALLDKGKLIPAFKIYEQALKEYDANSDPYDILKVKTKLADIKGQLANFEESNKMVDALLEEFESDYKDSLIIDKLYLVKGKNLRNLHDLDAAELWIRKAMDNMLSKDSLAEYCKAHLYLGVVMWDRSEAEAGDHMEENLKLFKEHYSEDDYMLGHPHNLLGAYRLHYGNLVEAKKQFTEAVKYFELGENDISQANGIFYLGIVNWNLKNYDVALERMEKAKAMFIGAYGPNHVRTTFVDNLIGNVYFDLGKHDLAEQYFNEAYVVRKEKYGPFHVETIGMLMNKANAQLSQGNNISGLSSLKEAARLFEEAEHKSYDYFKVYKSIGTVYAEMGEIDKAKKAFDQASANGLEVLTDDAVQWVDLRLEQVKLAETKELALDYFDKAFDVFQLSTNIEEIPASEFPDISHSMILFQTMVEKINFLVNRHQNDQDLNEIENTFAFVNKALEFGSYIRFGLEDDGNQAEFYSLSEKLFHDYLDLTWIMNSHSKQDLVSVENLHSIMEKSKAWILLDGLVDRRKESALVIDDSLKTEIKNINRKIDERYQLISQISESDAERLGEIRTAIYDLKESLAEIESSIQKDYPDYQVPSVIEEVSIHEMKAYMESRNSMFLHYAVTEDYVYTFGFNHLEHFFERTEIGNSFDEDILKLNASLRDRSISKDTIHHLASSLSKILINPIDQYLKQGTSVVIVPDDLLHYVPFDLLHAETEEESMIYSHNISYAYSGSILLELDKIDDARGNNFLAFAPKFDGSGQMAMRGEVVEDLKMARADLPALQGAQDEVEMLRELIGGNVLQQENATENKFKALAKENNIIHLATHALIDDRNPINSYLAFTENNTEEEDGNLYLWELNNLDLNSKMTVLSACNTGYGKLQEGEGLMSLGRAFIEAGSKSVVMSSWPAQDYATQKLMLGFYENLSQGMNKDQALRLAKLNYLEEADENLNHPFYWAGFFVNGLNDPIIEDHSFGISHLMMMGLILLLIILTYSKFKNK